MAVSSIVFTRDGCLIRRIWKIDSQDEKVILGPMEPIVSIVSVKPIGLEIEYFRFWNRQEPLEWIVDEELKEKLDKLKKLREQKERAEAMLSLSMSILKAIGGSPNYVVKVAMAKDPKSIDLYIGQLEKAMGLTYESIKQLEKNKEELAREIQRLLDLEPALKNEKVNVGYVELKIAKREKEGSIEITYFTKSASWRPLYKLIKNEGWLLEMLIEVESRSPFPWKNTKVEFTTETIATKKYTEPKPWFISPKPKVRATRAMKEFAAEAMPEALPPLPEAEKPEISSLGSVRFRINRPVDIPPFTSTQLSVYSWSLDYEDYAVWYAYRDTNVYEVIELTAPITLSPGEITVFSEKGEIVNKFRINRITQGSKVKWITRLIQGVEANRELIDYKEKKAGIVSDKTQKKVSYRYSIRNATKQKIRLIVYERIPISKDPKITTRIENISPKPKSVELGIITWEINLAPEEEKNLELTYIVEHPPDYRVDVI